MFNERKKHSSVIDKLKLALKLIHEELSILKFSSRYKISHKEAKEFKEWCLEAYYYKSYKSE